MSYQYIYVEASRALTVNVHTHLRPADNLLDSSG